MPAPLQAIPETARRATGAAPAPPVSVLIIEDSLFDQRMIQRVLATALNPEQVSAVTTLEDARDLLELHAVSLILLDNNLPDGKGADFVLELARHPEWKDIPVIIVSDWPSPFMWQKARLAGVSRVVNKSDFTSEVILEVLRALDPVH